MMSQSKAHIAQNVVTLLKTSGVVKAPVPVESIAKHLGIEVRYVSAPADVSGALVIKEGKAFIVVNEDHHENRQRFTIAHEIAHFRLHKTNEQAHLDEDFRVYKRDKKSSLATDPNEIEANQYAAELLMPQKFLLGDFLRARADRSGIAIRLANKYQVSPRAMEFRLGNLGLMVPSFDE